LTYTEQLVADAREAISGGRFADYSEAVLGGSTPWVA
jgi:hypothetical protein